MKIQVSAPSNIALIKYMGKLPDQGNRPTNSSLSMTLEHLRTFVDITLKTELENDQWAPLSGFDLEAPNLNQKAQDRFLNHFKMMKARWGIQQNFLIESANNFPADCGLASSASSFAALTLAAVKMFQELSPKKGFSEAELIDLSRQGSGSSCRSFFSPWALWQTDGVKPQHFKWDYLLHQVIVIEAEKKEVSSSEAHLRVSSSDSFVGRPERAEKRLVALTAALTAGEWRECYEICWSEFWDMHGLFETSNPHFSYMQPESLQTLRAIENLWKKNKDGPLVTMDAGANIHLLWRPEQMMTALHLSTEMEQQYKIISSKEFHRAKL